MSPRKVKNSVIESLQQYNILELFISIQEIIYKTVEDIKNSLLHMNGVKNAKVSTVEIDSSVNEIKS